MGIGAKEDSARTRGWERQRLGTQARRGQQESGVGTTRMSRPLCFSVNRCASVRLVFACPRLLVDGNPVADFDGEEVVSLRPERVPQVAESHQPAALIEGPPTL